MIYAPIFSPIYRWVFQAITDPQKALSGARFTPNPGDYLLDAINGNYLTDELSNRLTA